MMWITVATPPFGSIEQFDAVCEQVGENPDGLEARYAGTVADGSIRVVSLWTSKDHADRFMTERLGPALAAVLGPHSGRPELLAIDVARSYLREPVS